MEASLGAFPTMIRISLDSCVGALCAVGLAAACGQNSAVSIDDLSPPQYLAVPTVILAPDPFTPMAAEVFVSTDQAVTASVTVRYEDGTVGGPFSSLGDPSLSNRVSVLGLRPGENHEIQIEAMNSAGVVSEFSESFELQLEPLDDSLPPLDVTLGDESLITPGYTLFCAGGIDAGGAPLSHVCILDERGELYWYHRSQGQITDLRQLRNGNLLYIVNNRSLREITMTGEIVTEWFAASLNDDPAPPGAILVPIDTFHHEVAELPPGDEADFLVLSSAMHTVREYPLSVTDTEEVETADVVSDVIYTMKRNGEIVESWDLIDLIDVYRLSYDSLGSFWANFYGPDSRDWTHANASIYNPQTDEIVVSMRHQDALLAFGRSDGQVKWILGDHAEWDMPDALHLLEPPLDSSVPFEWPYHLHAPAFTSNDTVLLFDNGNNRAIAPAPPLESAVYSRAVEYRIDRETMSLTQEWVYGGPEDPWFSRAVGDADALPGTNNVLVTDGFRFGPGGTRWARVFEVTRSGEVVKEIKVQTPEGASEQINWLIYRAEHLTSLP